MVSLCVYISRERETDTYNYVLTFHTKRPSPCSARENSMPCVPACADLRGQPGVCALYTCGVRHAGCPCALACACCEYTLSPTTGWNQGHGAVAASPLLGYWAQPPNRQNISRNPYIFLMFLQPSAL